MTDVRLKRLSLRILLRQSNLFQKDVPINSEVNKSSIRAM
jgi:hypothetical protein